MKSILDPTFHYTSSANTDLRKTFARVRRELRKQQTQNASTGARESASNVSRIFQRSVRTPRSIIVR